MREKSQVGIDLTRGSILKTLMLFAIPIILTNVIQQVYILVDLMVVGQFVGSVGTVGVSTGGEISDLVSPLAIAFGTAGQVYIAQLVGAEKKQRAQRSIGTLLTMMLLMSIVAMCATIVFRDGILSLLQCPAQAWEQAESYMVIAAVGMPFVFGYNAICGVLRGMGESQKPLIFIIVAALVNIVLDFLLVAGLHMEAAGAAIATVASQFGSFAVAFWFMYRNRGTFGMRLSLAYFRLDREAMVKIIRLAIPTMVRILLVRFSMIWVNSNINSFGVEASSANSIGNRIYKLVETLMFGAETAASSMVGQNLGAKKPERAKNTVLVSLGFCLVIACIGSALFLGLPKTLYSVFTSEPAVKDLGVFYLQSMSLTIFVAAVISAFQAMITGSGNASLSLILGIVDSLGSRIGYSLLFVYVFDMGLLGFFWGHACARTISALISVCYFLSGRWRRRKLMTE